jgi:hypothetical protein
MLDPRKFSFGTTAAIVTSMGLIIGLGSATVSPATIVGGLLIVAVADNITDSLSVHMYQEAEQLEARAAFRAMLMNFVARVLIGLTFAIVVLVLPSPYAVIIALGWGLLLLIGLSYMLARARDVRALPEVGKHLGVAVLVIAASRVVGLWILRYVK